MGEVIKKNKKTEGAIYPVCRSQLDNTVRITFIAELGLDRYYSSLHKAHLWCFPKALKREMTSHLGLVFLLLSLLVLGVSSSSGFEVDFKGPQYISYDLRSNRISAESNQISLEFKTFHPSGLLVYSSGTQGDFITLELIHSKLR